MDRIHMARITGMRTTLWRLAALLITAFFCLGLLSSGQTVDVLSKEGSRGEEVRQIQTKLNNWGYNPGKVDGIYGKQTKEAVIRFQKKNGLTPDGIVGSRTWYKIQDVYVAVTQMAEGE